jgi:hypothetical protein
LIRLIFSRLPVTILRIALLRLPAVPFVPAVFTLPPVIVALPSVFVRNRRVGGRGGLSRRFGRLHGLFDRRRPALIKLQKARAVRFFYAAHMTFNIHAQFLQFINDIFARYLELPGHFMYSHFRHSPASVCWETQFSLSHFSTFAANPASVTANTARSLLPTL